MFICSVTSNSVYSNTFQYSLLNMYWTVSFITINTEPTYLFSFSDPIRFTPHFTVQYIIKARTDQQQCIVSNNLLHLLFYIHWRLCSVQLLTITNYRTASTLQFPCMTDWSIGFIERTHAPVFFEILCKCYDVQVKSSKLVSAGITKLISLLFLLFFLFTKGDILL